MHRHVTDTTMQMQSQLPIESLGTDIQAIVFAALFQKCQIQFIVFPAKHLPCHLDITVGRDIDRRRWRFLFQRQAQGPAAKDIPLLDAGACLVNGGEKSWRLAGEKCSALAVGKTRWSVAGGSWRGVCSLIRLCTSPA